MKRGFTISIFLFFALAACSANLAAQKRRAEDRRNIAAAYMKQGNYTEALRELLAAEKLYADDPDLQNDLGFAYMEKDRPELAIAHFKKALELKPDYSSARNNLGVAYLRNKQWDEAIACFKKLSQNLLYTTPQNALVNLGLAYYHKQDLAQAESYYQKALSLYEEGISKDATYVKALHGLGLTYMAMGRGQDAVAALEKAVRVAPRIAELFFALGQAYTLAQEYSNALQAYNKVVELVPDRALANEALAAAEKLKTKNRESK